MSLQLGHIPTIGKNLLNSNISPTCPHNMVNFGPLTAETDWRVWGTPANFNGFCFLASFLQRRRSTEVNQTAWCLAVSWACTLYIHFWGLLPPNGILPAGRFTLRPSLAFSYIGSVTPQYSSSGRQPNFATWYLHASCCHPVRHWAVVESVITGIAVA